MTKEEALKKEIHELIKTAGFDAASDYIGKILSEFSQNEISNNTCPFCKIKLSVLSKKNSISRESCNNCNKEFLVYKGKARTSKSKNVVRGRAVTIRSYDIDGTERKIEIYQNRGDKPIEIKSGDEFNIYINRLINSNFYEETYGWSNDDEEIYSIFFNNKTVRSNATGMAKLAIVEDLSAESLIPEESQLKRLPPENNPDAIVQKIALQMLEKNIDSKLAVKLIVDTYEHTRPEFLSCLFNSPPNYQSHIEWDGDTEGERNFQQACEEWCSELLGWLADKIPP